MAWARLFFSICSTRFIRACTRTEAGRRFVMNSGAPTQAVSPPLQELLSRVIVAAAVPGFLKVLQASDGHGVRCRQEPVPRMAPAAPVLQSAAVPAAPALQSATAEPALAAATPTAAAAALSPMVTAAPALQPAPAALVLFLHVSSRALPRICAHAPATSSSSKKRRPVRTPTTAR